MTDLAELRQLIAQIALISQVSGTSYEGKIAKDTSEAIGGRRPPGSDHEPKPRRPKRPLIEGDAGSEKEWDEYEEELAAWRSCYQRRTPEYFRRRLERGAAVPVLLDEARETLEAWKRMPIPKGQPPALGDPQWKRWVAESDLQTKDLVRMFDVSRQYIQQVRKAYREAA